VVSRNFAKLASLAIRLVMYYITSLSLRGGEASLCGHLLNIAGVFVLR
jgi:hypothetical protein